MEAYDDEEDAKKQERLLCLLPLEDVDDDEDAKRDEPASSPSSTSGPKGLAKQAKGSSTKKSSSRASAKSKAPKGRTVGMATSKKVHQFYNSFA